MSNVHITTDAETSSAQKTGSWARVVVTKEIEVWVLGKLPETRMEALDLFNKHHNSQRIKEWKVEKL